MLSISLHPMPVTCAGELRPISLAYLDHILEAVLNLLVSLSLPHTGVPVEKLLDSMVNDHEVPRSVAVQVMQWFGDIHNDGKWAMDAGSVIQELGLSILRNHKHRPISKDALLTQWRGLVGDTFEKGVNLNLLAGNYIEDARKAQMLSYFPASDLPMEPVARFRDLFLTKSRWKVEDITPFLSDIAVDTKERDRLLLKYARGVTDAEGLWYTARAQYSG
ncbi:hypothetical protein AX16_001072 [Volvariella volvacea WC 439]|nr:hypothetical protein AX16_001072 [Volvariella volvacea WC 439]